MNQLLGSVKPVGVPQLDRQINGVRCYINRKPEGPGMLIGIASDDRWKITLTPPEAASRRRPTLIKLDESHVARAGISDTTGNPTERHRAVAVELDPRNTGALVVQIACRNVYTGLGCGRIAGKMERCGTRLYTGPPAQRLGGFVMDRVGDILRGRVNTFLTQKRYLDEYR